MFLCSWKHSSASLCMGQLQFLSLFKNLSSLCCWVLACPKTWLPSLSWRHLSSVSFYHNRVLVSGAAFEMRVAQRLQPSWERQYKKVCDRWQIAAAELVLSPRPARGAEWMSIICPTCTKGIATHKHTNSWPVQTGMSPCIALPSYQQLAQAWINRVLGSTQTRQLIVKVGMCWGSLFWEGLQAIHTTRGMATKQWSQCSLTIWRDIAFFFIHCLLHSWLSSIHCFII